MVVVCIDKGTPKSSNYISLVKYLTLISWVMNSKVQYKSNGKYIWCYTEIISRAFLMIAARMNSYRKSTFCCTSSCSPRVQVFMYLLLLSYLFFYEYAYQGKNFHLLSFSWFYHISELYIIMELQKKMIIYITYGYKGEKELMNWKQV